MRLAYAEGLILAVLAPFVVYFLGIGKLTLLETLFSVFALIGIWTILSAFALISAGDRIFYVTWGLVLLSFSSLFVTHIQYAIALILIAIIASLLINSATRREKGKISNVKVGQNPAGQNSGV